MVCALAVTGLVVRREVVGVAATAYITLITGDLRHACVDGRVDAPSEARPVIALHGDTLYVVDQRAGETGANGGPSTQVRRFIVSDATCEWLPVTGTRW